MNRPDPELSSRISEEFDDLAGVTMSLDDVERLKNVGEPLFTKDDIYATADQLSQLFRSICVENHITEAYFNEKYKQYAINVLGKTPQSAANNRANTIKLMKHGDRLTWKKFLEIVTLVLGIRLKNIIAVLQNTNTNEVKTYSLRDNDD